MTAKRPILTVGEPAPWFSCATSGAAQFFFGAAAGRYTVLSFLGAPGSDTARTVMRFINANAAKFDDTHLSFFGVVESGPVDTLPMGSMAIRYIWDHDGAIRHLFGDEPMTMVFDSMLRVRAIIPLTDLETHRQTLITVLSNLPPLGTREEPNHAPVLILPRIFEPGMCRHLIALYHQHGGKQSGYMRQLNDRTTPALDLEFKRRKDFVFDTQPEFADLRDALRRRMVRRLLPEIAKSFQFHATRLERHVVAHYSSSDQGHFNPHRDNTTTGTAHRRFACTINLNADAFEGGDLRFPEFGPRTYRAPTGGAVVFSCSLLHEATPVTKGERYAFLPFFYDDAAATIREQNASTLDLHLPNEDTL